jgi:hypothetical protein
MAKVLHSLYTLRRALGLGCSMLDYIVHYICVLPPQLLLERQDMEALTS